MASTSDKYDDLGLYGLAMHNKALWVSGKFSDFTIECESREFKVHRAIICPQAAFLESLCTSFKEGSEGRATLVDVNAFVFEKALQFFYTQFYDETRPLDSRAATPDQPGSILLDASLVAKEEDGTDNEANLPDDNDANLPDNNEANLPEVTSCESETPRENYGRFLLLLHVRLYHLAEYLQADALKQEALSRCACFLMENLDPEQALDGIRESLRHADTIDTELRCCVVRSCIQQKERVLKHPALDEVLTEFEPVAWTLMKEKEKEYAGKVDKVSKKLTAARHEKTTLKATVNSLQAEVSGLKEEIRYQCKITTDCEKCSNCSNEFGAYLASHSLLRCRKCNCRQGTGLLIG